MTSKPIPRERIGAIGWDVTGVRFAVMDPERGDPVYTVLILSADPKAKSKRPIRTMKPGSTIHSSHLKHPFRWEDGEVEKPRYVIWSGRQGINTPGLPSEDHWIVVDSKGNYPPLFFGTLSEAEDEAIRLNNGGRRPRPKREQILAKKLVGK